MKNSDLSLALVYCIVFIIFFVLLEFTARKNILKAVVTRRIAHLTAGVSSLLTWKLASPELFLAGGSALLILFSYSQYRGLLKSVHSVKRKTFGEIFLPAGILLTYLLAHDKPEVFIPSILIMAIADSFAGIISDLRNRGRPSQIASFGFFVVALIILLFYVNNPVEAVAIAFVVMVVEKVSPYGSDNATVPTFAALLLLL